MKVLLTGATGFIGKNLGPRLVEHDHELVCLTRDKSQLSSKFNYACQVIEPDELPETKGIEAIINLAGASIAKKWTQSYKKILRESRIDFTKNIIKNLETSNLKVFLQASATGYYQASAQTPITEDGAKNEGFLGNLVAEWEAASADLKARKVYFRQGMILGPEAQSLSKMRPAFEWGLGSRLGSGKQYMPWVHIEDVLRAFVAALEDETFSGVYNLTAPDLITNANFTKNLLEVLERPSLAPPVPAAVLSIILGPMSQILLDSLPVQPKRLMQSQFKFKYKDIKNALKASDLK